MELDRWSWTDGVGQMELDRWTYREIYEKTERTDRQRNINTDRRTDGVGQMESDRWTFRWTYRETDGQTKIQTDR
jgi:hypothetical protein